MLASLKLPTVRAAEVDGGRQEQRMRGPEGRLAAGERGLPAGPMPSTMAAGQALRRSGRCAWRVDVLGGGAHGSPRRSEPSGLPTNLQAA